MATFTQGDYTYTTTSATTVRIEATSKTQTSYEPILTKVVDNNITYIVNDMEACFKDCSSLITAPAIPDSIIYMDSCFQNCTSLTGDIYIWARHGATLCFSGTTQPITLHAMDNNTDVCNTLAATATNDNVYVNVRPETPLTFTDTQMNYMTNDGLKSLSLQTNANLVQCEVPDLVNGGTITTNVNDALIDLWNRREQLPLYKAGDV